MEAKKENQKKRCEDGQDQRDVMLLALKMEEGDNESMNGQPLEARKGN